VKIGLLLSGSGMYDGTDIHEAVIAMLALERGGAQPVCLAIDRAQFHVVDHLSGDEKEGESRQVVAEAARLGRGKVQILGEAFTGALQGLVIPGGYGAPKSLISGFMDRGGKRELLPEVRALLDDLTGRRKPVGAISLGRTVLRAYFDQEMEEAELSLPASEVVVDSERLALFTPGFLGTSRLDEAAVGIDAMIARLMKMISRKLPLRS
jgi:enhancing lycopene biosynthesis protein 2